MNMLGLDENDELTPDDFRAKVNPYNLSTFHFFCHTCDSKAFDDINIGLKKRKGKAKSSPVQSTGTEENALSVDVENTDNESQSGESENEK